MKAKLLFFVLVMGVFSLQAQNGKVIITGSRFTYPLLEKWIAEFSKTNPDVAFRIIARGGPNVDSANVIINAHTLSPEEIRPNYSIINIGRYALLPVANSKSPLLAGYEEKGIKPADFKQLFFYKHDAIEEHEKKKKKDNGSYKPTLYTRAQIACAPTTFARYYGFEQADIIGKPIGGDDKHLIQAIQKDTNGLTYNVLGLIYDLKTRAVKPGLTVLPVDLNNNGKLDENEKIYASLDNLTQYLETQNNPKIPIEYVNISIPTNKTDASDNIDRFIKWVLSEGQKYNHEYGFLDFERETLAKQVELLNKVNH